MKRAIEFVHAFFKSKRHVVTLFWIGIILFTMLSGLLLFNQSVIGGLLSTLIDIGLDPLRAQFIAALLMTACIALLGSALGRRKLAACIGASGTFCIGFLGGFVHDQLQSVFDPGGHLEPLNSGALFNTCIIMLALATISAFIGASVGQALGEILLDPPYQLLRLLLQRNRDKDKRGSVIQHTDEGVDFSKKMMTNLIMNWLATGTMVILLILVSNSRDLFILSPDVGIHRKPITTNSTLIQDRLISPALGGQTRLFRIYLPPSYNTSAGKARYYPVLYLLHGSPGTPLDWITGGKAQESADTLIATKRIPELIMVLPDGNGRPGMTSEWGNSFAYHQLIEDYVVHDLVEYIDKRYRTLADTEHRAIGGLSMGGFGAINIAIHHPDTFGSVFSFGGYYQAEGRIWGNDAQYRQQNSPLDSLPYRQQAWKLHILLGSASQDQPYYNDTRQFMQELDQLHIGYHFDLQKGHHSWKVWQVQFYKMLPLIDWKR